MTRTNPLLSPSALPHHLPPYPDLQDEDYREAILEGMAEQLRELDAVATDPSAPTVENVVEAWERSGQTLRRSMDAFWPVAAADTNARRDAIRAELAPLLAAHGDAIMLDRRLYDRLLALRARVDAGDMTLDEETA